MAKSKITAGGRTTVPTEIRRQLGAVAGTPLVWTAMPDGTVLVRFKTRLILGLAGMLVPPDGRHVRLEDMNPLQ